MKVTKKPNAIKNKPPINTSPGIFESSFQKRLGQSPLEWVETKVEGGSQLKSVQYLFDISAAEIARQNNCTPQPFDRYYKEYLKSKEATTVVRKTAKVYNKLVRDRIPEIIEASGKTCTVETLTDEQYIAMLDAKLNEELAEYQESKSLEELADLLEVMGAVVKARGYSWDELTEARKKKREERGGFEKKILLKEVYEIARQAHAQIGATPIHFADRVLQITASAGVAGYPETCENPMDLLTRADWAMYTSKQNGRNRITIDSDKVRNEM